MRIDGRKAGHITGALIGAVAVAAVALTSVAVAAVSGRWSAIVAVAVSLAVAAGWWAMVDRPRARRARAAEALAAHHAARFDAEFRRRDAAERLHWHHLNHDDLTGLANRRRVLDELERRDDAHPTSILFVEVPSLQSLNDNCGFHVGDEVLLGVAARLNRSTGDTALVARWSGSAFVVVTGDVGAAARDLEDRVSRALDAPIETSIGRCPTRIDVGTVAIGRGESATNAVARADAAMRRRRRDEASIVDARVRAAAYN